MPVVTARNAIVKRLTSLHRSYGSWREVAAQIGISPAMAWRLVNEPEYEPKDPEIRRKLGLPVAVVTYQGPDGRFVKR